jgi:hypothetical protein
MEKRKAGGRPSLYSDDLAEEICDRLADGESLRAICKEPAMPSMTTVLSWADEDKGGFRGRYACAREAQAEDMDGLILAVAEETAPENAQAQRVKLEAYRWRASKLAPKRYGDKLDLTSDGEGMFNLAAMIEAGRKRVHDRLAIEHQKRLGSGEQPVEGEFREVDQGENLA